MPTLVVGDLHFKQYEVLPRGSELVAGLCAERVVFCGDLCDDWGATGEWALGSLSLMAGWLREVRASGVRADVLLGNKMDAAAFFDFDLEALTQRVHAINPRVEIIPISAKTGEGMDRWCAWLEEQVAQWKK